MATNGKGRGKGMDDLLDKETPEGEGTDKENGGKIAVLEVTDFNLISETLQAEVIDTVRSQFTGSVIYNIPRRSQTGRTHWPACDQMEGGCSYDGQKHIHIVDVGIHGALVAAGVYGNLDFGVSEMPVVTEQGNKLYWVCEVYCHDLIRGNRITRYQFEPMLRKDKSGGFYENEFAMQSVQSKGIRGMILAILPPQLRELWKQDYLAGREPFDPSRILETGGRGNELPPGQQKKLPPKKEKEKTKKKEKSENDKEKPGPQTQGSNDLSEVINQFAEKHKLSVELVGAWSATAFETQGKAMLNMTQAMQDDNKSKEFLDSIKEYEKKAESSGEEEVEM